MASNTKRIRVTVLVDVDLETFQSTYGHATLREAEQDAMEHVPALVNHAVRRDLELVANGSTLVGGE